MYIKILIYQMIILRKWLGAVTIFVVVERIPEETNGGRRWRTTE